jgi:acetyl-CoA carboxylase carboxyltransferase component
VWSPELEELAHRRRLAEELGGPAGIERQRRQGKLTVLERLERLTDKGSFHRFAEFRGHGVYGADGRLEAFTPSGEVQGMGAIDDRKVIISAGDFTVRGGSASGGNGGLGQEMTPVQRALAWRLPYIRLLDSAGGSVRGFETLGRTYLPDANSFTRYDVDLLSSSPVVSAVLGAAAGLPALHTSLAHWNVMVRGKSQVFPGGPPVVRAALGQEIDKEELGGAHIHTRVSGVVDNAADTEDEAFELIRQFLSYLPSSVWELPPRHESADPIDRRAPELANLVPRDPRRVHDPKKLIRYVVDDGSFFEIAPDYGRSRVTGLARVDGYPVGVMANNPRAGGGATDVAGGEKAVRLIQLCETFHLPLVDFPDEPGLMVGIESEKAGIERAGARLVCVTCDSQMPWITFVIRRLFGVGGQTHQRPTGMFRRYAWPSATWGSMHIAGGTAAAYRREIEAADDPKQAERDIENRLRAVASPFRTAEATGQDIIDPRDTRPLLAEFIGDAQRILQTQLGPPAQRYRP